MLEVIFLWTLALMWIIFATVQDLRSREIANWLSFSLIIFALGFRFFYSLFEAGEFSFFYQGLIGLGIFFILGNLFYYSKIFAGGDAKLMIALGAILPIYGTFLENAKFFFIFLFLFFFAGAVYSLIVSVSLQIQNFKAFRKEFKVQFRKNKKIFYLALSVGIIIMCFGFIESILFVFGVLLFLTGYLYIYAKTIEEVCMVKTLNVGKLTEGDWLYEDLKVGRKKIKATWNGLTKEEIAMIKKHGKVKKVRIKQGIPFTPAFLISLIILFWIYFSEMNLFAFLF